MRTQQNGGPAFPVAGSDHNYPIEGMTLRDYFAAKAMQSIISSPNEMEDLIDTLGAPTAYAKVSETAYVIADAMLRAGESS